MQAYRGQEALKTLLIVQMQAHHDAGEIVQGGHVKDGTGCTSLIGEKLQETYGREAVNLEHEKVAALMDVPIELVYMLDDLFEALPNDHAVEFPLRFLKAIRPGADLSRIWAQFAHWILADDVSGMLNVQLAPLADDVRFPVTRIAELLCLVGAGETLTPDQKKEGYFAAYAARDATGARPRWNTGVANVAWTAWCGYPAFARYAREYWPGRRPNYWIAKSQADKLISLLEAAQPEGEGTKETAML